MSVSNVADNPTYISHYGLRTKRLNEMKQWYQTVFGAKIQHENEFLAFMTFDDEHHRLVIFEDAGTVDKPESAAGIDHVGYGVASFRDLVEAYERLKAKGITPFLPLNHRFTTSLYYRDPDGNAVELSVDNFRTKAECNSFIRSDDMAEMADHLLATPSTPTNWRNCFIVEFPKNNWPKSAFRKRPKSTNRLKAKLL